MHLPTTVPPFIAQSIKYGGVSYTVKVPKWIHFDCASVKNALVFVVPKIGRPLYDLALTRTPHGHGETYFQSISIEVSQPYDPIDSRIRIWRHFPDAIKAE